MPAASWTAGSDPDLSAALVPPPPLTVQALWRSAAAVLATSPRLSVATAIPGRIVTAMPHVFAGGKVRYRRGTYGLMPDEWGVVDDISITDTAADFERRDAHGELYAAGCSGTVYRMAMAIRMPIDRQMPEKGDQFHFVVRGKPLLFTVWAGVAERWRSEGIRMVDLQARHYVDFPDAIPRRIDDITVDQSLASDSFT